MDEADAREIVREKARELRRLPYAKLRERLPKTKVRLLGGLITVDGGGCPTRHEYFERGGATYELETQVDWDDDEGGDIRVSLAVWSVGGEWRLIGGPIASDGFIVAPDGSLVDE